jgi:type II secretory pathway pseudopilin PulG
VTRLSLSPRVPPRTGGFTLLELLVTAVLLVLVASVAMTAVGDRGEQDLDMGEIQVRDALGHARALARSARSPHAVVFDVARDRFAIIDETGSATADLLTRRDAVVDFARPNQPRTVEITSAEFGATGSAAIFDAQGVPLTGGTIVLQSGRHMRTLTLDAATGDLSGS